MSDEMDMCYVAKGKCGHYYWASAILPDKVSQRLLAKEMAQVIRRGDSVEMKPIQFVRSGGLDWDEYCRKGKCAMRPTLPPVTDAAAEEVSIKP